LWLLNLRQDDNAINTPMIAITTSNSTKVKPLGPLPFLNMTRLPEKKKKRK
jgi:hypothetical protein